LKKLSEQSSKHQNKPKEFLQNLSHLWETKEVSVQCNEKRNWTGIRGRASVEPNEVMGDPKINAPYISLSTDHPKIKGSPDQEEKESFQSTLFHEQLHNLGMRHGEGVESTYACQICCNPKTSQEELPISCKVCVGDYKENAKDKEYVRDMITWRKNGESIREDLPERNVINYIKETKDTRWGMFALAEINADIFSPVGVQLAIELSKMIPEKDQTEEEKQMMKRALENSSKDFKAFLPVSNIVAKSYLSLYQNDNSKKAMDLLEKNKKMLKNLQKNSKSYITEYINENLKQLLLDVTLKEYPQTGPESVRARKLYEELKL